MQKANYSFDYTKHGSERMSQRNFQDEDIDLIAHCGTYIGDDAVFMSNKDVDLEIRSLNELIKRIDRLRNKKIVIKGGALVTCYSCRPREVKRLQRRSRDKI
jgi:hypothetical protein